MNFHNPPQVPLKPYAYAQASTELADGEVSLLDAINYLWRAKFVLVLSGFVSFLLAVVYLVFVSEPIYRAHSVLRLVPEQINAVDVDHILSFEPLDNLLLNTELEILKSDALISEVIENLDLENHPEFSKSSAVAQYISFLKNKLFPSDSREASPESRRERALSHLRSMIDARLVSNSYLLRVQVQAEDAQLSAEIANALTDSYIGRKLLEKQRETGKVADWLTQEIHKFENEILVRDREITTLKANIQNVNEDELASETRAIREMRARMLDLTNARNALVIPDAPGIGDFNQSSSVNLENADQSTERTNHSAIQLTERAALIERRDSLDAQIGNLTITLARLEAALSQRVVDLNKLEELQRLQDGSEELHEQFSIRLRETSLQYGLINSQVETLRPATVPLEPSGPRWLRLLGGASIAGGFLAALAVLVKMLLWPNLRLPTDCGSLVEVSTVMALPQLGMPAHPSVLQKRNLVRRDLAQTALREMRTRLFQNTAFHQGARITTFLGGISRDGGPTVASALALNLAKLKTCKVLLIDADLKNAPLNDPELEGSEVTTLASLLEAKGVTPPFIPAYTEHNLAVIPAGFTKNDPLDVLASNKFADVIDQFRLHFDEIIISLPPVAAGSSVSLMSPVADQLVLVVRQGSPLHKAKRYFSRLSSFDMKPDGLVLSHAQRSSLGSFYGLERKGFLG